MKKKSELQVFREYLQKHGLRYTQEREQIIKAIFSTHDHFDVDMLYLAMRQKGIRISKASIYRIMPLLIDAGLIQDVFFEGGRVYYEHTYGHEPHCHLRCIECGKIEEFVEPRLKDIEKDLAERFGYKILKSNLEVKGFCPECCEKFLGRK
ncbi:MAG: transcriptional repressor [Nitrospiraceae bacterium]|nr:transcriptional repressor [Nitrospiraceae bacterium]